MTVEDDRARVVMLLDSGRAQEAVDLLAPLLVVHADDSELWCLNAHALLAVDRNTDAMASAKQASALRPTAAEPHRIASLVLTKVGDLEGSARAAREGVRLEPDDPAAWERVCYALGALLAALGSSGDRADLPRIRPLADEVLAAADRVVAVAPTSSSAYAARGYALAAARRPDLAADAVARAGQLDPGGQAAQQVLGAPGDSPQEPSPPPAEPPRPAYGSEPPPATDSGGSFLTGRGGSRLALVIALLLVVALAVSVLT